MGKEGGGVSTRKRGGREGGATVLIFIPAKLPRTHIHDKTVSHSRVLGWFLLPPLPGAVCCLPVSSEVVYHPSSSAGKHISLLPTHSSPVAAP